MNPAASLPLAARLGRPVAAAAAVMAALALVACNDDDDSNETPTTPFTVTNIVSDTAAIPAAHTDPNLVNAWGIAFNPTGFVWVADAGTDKSTLYDGNGVPQTLVVTTPPDPTGIVFSGSSDFVVTRAGVSGPSRFIFATEGGTISGWAPAVAPTSAVQVFDGGSAGKSYKGLAIAASGGANFLYATDFHNGRVDMFDRTFAPFSTTGRFVDPNLPAGYAPFGIQAIGSLIYVTYARQDAAADEEVKGAGLGLVDVFDTAGAFVRRLATGGPLNAPWGLAMAPANFGSFSNALLVGNFGDGRINAFDPATGNYLGALRQADGTPIAIDGLWGLAFGNGVNSQPTTTLFFTAGPADETHGLYGRIDLKP